MDEVQQMANIRKSTKNLVNDSNASNTNYKRGRTGNNKLSMTEGRPNELNKLAVVSLE
jgi:hypothetical protein